MGKQEDNLERDKAEAKRQKALKAQFQQKLTRKNRPQSRGYFGPVGKALNE